jgi:hypothetical protein
MECSECGPPDSNLDPVDVLARRILGRGQGSREHSIRKGVGKGGRRPRKKKNQCPECAECGPPDSNLDLREGRRKEGGGVGLREEGEERRPAFFFSTTRMRRMWPTRFEPGPRGRAGKEDAGEGASPPRTPKLVVRFFFFRVPLFNDGRIFFGVFKFRRDKLRSF